jgi:5-methylthioadenosine/S-adenosylhomocysteine deaminase
VTDAEQDLLAQHAVKVLHCPSSNLKLGSGIAPVTRMRGRGISVSLGADGAACNNTLDMFQEMRLAATLQAMRSGPGSLPAREAVWMATREGARALGLDGELGVIAAGARADVIVVATDGPHHSPAADPYSLLVYGCRASDVRATVIDGHERARDGQLTWAAWPELRSAADEAVRAVRARAGI